VILYSVLVSNVVFSVLHFNLRTWYYNYLGTTTQKCWFAAYDEQIEVNTYEVLCTVHHVNFHIDHMMGCTQVFLLHMVYTRDHQVNNGGKTTLWQSTCVECASHLPSNRIPIGVFGLNKEDHRNSMNWCQYFVPRRN